MTSFSLSETYSCEEFLPELLDGYMGSSTVLGVCSDGTIQTCTYQKLGPNDDGRFVNALGIGLKVMAWAYIVYE